MTLRRRELRDGGFLPQSVKIKGAVIQTSVRFRSTYHMAKSLFLEFITVSEHRTLAGVLSDVFFFSSSLMERRKNNFEQGGP